ncbi:MAG TPA: sigma-70 family RNA polymerase sigma factor [Ktedonobacteraceae bacterium]|nr:sigma-70 family RNA polymerase sigma factor [Ktedonobacteraceae bacterium]
MAALTDEDLVARCKSELPRNTRSYEILVQRHMNRVYSQIYQLVSNKEEAEDITQEVFVKVYHGLHKFEQQASFSSWLYRITANTTIDALDKIKRRPKTIRPGNNRNGSEHDEDNDPLASQATPIAGPEESVMRAELRECIRNVLQKLDRDQARLLVMRDLNDVSYDEIAKALQASLSAVKMRIHRARLAFQEAFNQLCGRYLNFTVPSRLSPKEKAR